MVRFKGKDQIEGGYQHYTEANYGSSPGGAVTVLHRIGYLTEVTPQYDPELMRDYVLRDSAIPAPIAILRKRENVKLRLKWQQGTLGDYAQKSMLTDKENWFLETKIYRSPGGAGYEYYLYWTGVKWDVLTVKCSVGEPIEWIADCIGKLYDTKLTTIHSYGAAPGDPWEWKDAYLEISANDANWTVIPDVTDWEIRINNRLKQNFVFNNSGSKQLVSLEEMEIEGDGRFTMNLQDDTYISYLLDQTEPLYVRLTLPDSKWIKLNKVKFSVVEPVLKPEDLIACRVTCIARWVTNGFT